MGNRSLAEVLDEMGYVERTKLHDVRPETARETAIKVNKEVTEDVTKEMAKGMFNEGVPIEKIARVTRFSVEALKEILNL